MARRNPSPPYWARTLLESFTPAELQAGAYIDKPRKLRDGTIKRISTRNIGTGIPASTWSRMQAGLIKPGPKTLDKLYKFKQRYQYNKLKASGASTQEAKKFSRSDFPDAMKRAAQYRNRAVKVARALSKVQNKRIDPDWIVYHMMKGERDIEDWDKYVTAITSP